MPMNLLFCLLFDILFVQTSIFKGRPFLKNFTNSNLDLKLSIEWTFLNQYYQRINYKCSKKSQSPFIQSKIVSILTLKIETLRFFLIRVKINFKVIINFEVTNLDPSNKNYFIIDETKAKKKKNRCIVPLLLSFTSIYSSTPSPITVDCIESLITNGSIRRGVYTHDRGHIARGTHTEGLCGAPGRCRWLIDRESPGWASHRVSFYRRHRI